MYESWQVIPQGHCLFDSSTLPPTAPLIMVFMYFGSTKQSKMAKLTIEAVDRGSNRNGTDSSPKVWEEEKKKKKNSIHLGVNHTGNKSLILIMIHLKKNIIFCEEITGCQPQQYSTVKCASFHPFTAKGNCSRLQGKLCFF